MGEHRLSVALCTFNGARHLQEQIDSIRSQSRPPDELVACDDGSVDGTKNILEAFASASRFPVRISLSERTLGSTKNFEKAIALCRGDVIVLSDQDDAWHPDKLGDMEAAFASRPSVGAVFSDAEMVDEALEPLGYRLWESIGFGRTEQRRVARGNSLDVLLKHNVATGAAMAFRSAFRDLVLPIPPEWVHDAWIAVLIAAVSDLGALRKPLIRYRQHRGSQIGAVRMGFAERVARAKGIAPEAYSAMADRYQMAYDRLRTSGWGVKRPETMTKLLSKIRHSRARSDLPPAMARRLPLVAGELLTLRYHRYSFGLHSAARDLLLW